jgi:hypothetical protein
MNQQPSKKAADEATEKDSQMPAVVEKADNQQLQHFVTTIKTAEQQVGENIISALQHDDTVAVLTTVISGPDGQQRVVTAALDPSVMSQVQELLTGATKKRQDEKQCVGFHCLIKPKNSTEESTA